MQVYWVYLSRRKLKNQLLLRKEFQDKTKNTFYEVKADIEFLINQYRNF